MGNGVSDTSDGVEAVRPTPLDQLLPTADRRAQGDLASRGELPSTLDHRFAGVCCRDLKALQSKTDSKLASSRRTVHHSRNLDQARQRAAQTPPRCPLGSASARERATHTPQPELRMARASSPEVCQRPFVVGCADASLQWAAGVFPSVSAPADSQSPPDVQGARVLWRDANLAWLLPRRLTDAGVEGDEWHGRQHPDGPSLKERCR